MNEIEKRIRKIENIRKRNEQVKKENEKKLNKVLKQIKDEKQRKYWERLNRSDTRRFWVWRFKMKADIEKQGIYNAPLFSGLWIGYNRDTGEVTMLLGWEKSQVEAKNQRKAWMPEGEVKTFKVDDLEILDRLYISSYKIGG